MNRAAEVAAALETLRRKLDHHSDWDGVMAAYDALARLLRESQPEPALEMVDAFDPNDPDVQMTGGYFGNPFDKPEPAAPAVGEVEKAIGELIVGMHPGGNAKFLAKEYRRLQEREARLGVVSDDLRAALADVARLEEEQAKEAREWNDLRDRYDATVLELTQARAALAAAEVAGEKLAVAAESVTRTARDKEIIFRHGGQRFFDDLAGGIARLCTEVESFRARAPTEYLAEQATTPTQGGKPS